MSIRGIVDLVYFDWGLVVRGVMIPMLSTSAVVAVVDDFGYDGEVEIGVAPDEHRFVVSGGEDLSELRFDLAFVESGLVDLVGEALAEVAEELDDDGLRLVARSGDSAARTNCEHQVPDYFRFPNRGSLIPQLITMYSRL